MTFEEWEKALEEAIIEQSEGRHRLMYMGRSKEDRHAVWETGALLPAEYAQLLLHMRKAEWEYLQEMQAGEPSTSDEFLDKL